MLYSVLSISQVNNTLTLDRTKRQWVHLGIHTEACMTRPETCGAAGGAISLWVRVTDCDDGIISSLTVTSGADGGGSAISCAEYGHVLLYALFSPFIF